MKRPRAWILAMALAVPAGGCGGGGGGPTEPEVPVITSIDVSEVRAGEVVVIRGQNLSATAVPMGSLAPAQNAVQIMVDGRLLTPESMTDTEIRVRIPIDLAPGIHTLVVLVNGVAAHSISFIVEIFTVTGVYEGTGRIASATCNDPAAQAELRQIFPIGATGVGLMAALDQRPALFLESQNFTETEILEASGTLDGDGSFHTTVQDTDPEIVSEFAGRFSAAGTEVRVQATNTITLDVTFEDGSRLLCEVKLEFDERRVSTTLAASIPAPGPVDASGPSILEELHRLTERRIR